MRERRGGEGDSFSLEEVGREGVIFLYAQQPTIATADAGRGGEPNVVVEEGELNVVW
jgi:hypothetical protein